MDLPGCSTTDRRRGSRLSARCLKANAINFLPRVRTPVLMVNGRYDSILPADSSQEPMFQRLGTPDADKRRVVLDSGHFVGVPEVRNLMIREVLDWLDRYLGKT